MKFIAFAEIKNSKLLLVRPYEFFPLRVLGISTVVRISYLIIEASCTIIGTCYLTLYDIRLIKLDICY